MDEITFEASFGDERKTVKLSKPYGGGEGYHLYIDNFYQGVLLKRNGEWWFTTDSITIDEIQILGEMIDLKFG